MTDPHGVPDDAPPPSVQRPYLYVPGEPLPADYPSSLNPPPVIAPQPNKKRWGQAGGGAAAGVGVAAKAGLLTKLFFALKASAVLVKFKFAASMVISVVAYAFIFGWWYAVGFVALIAVHEVGHMVALRSMGVKASLPTFIPFMGAFVTMKSAPKSVGHEATAALAGPAVGTVGALVALEMSHVFNSPLLRALAYTAFFINLFNLVPALPLDGGRVAGALHPALWIVGLAAAGIFAFVHPSPVLIFILIIGIFELVKRWRTRKWIDAAYYAIRPSTRVAIGSAYTLVAIVCLWGMSIAYVRR
ncbi:MAG TPA: site-2 protease family protein [Acidothermaceae bacterium]